MAMMSRVETKYVALLLFIDHATAVRPRRRYGCHFAVVCAPYFGDHNKTILPSPEYFQVLQAELCLYVIYRATCVLRITYLTGVWIDERVS